VAGANASAIFLLGLALVIPGGFVIPSAARNLLFLTTSRSNWFQ